MTESLNTSTNKFVSDNCNLDDIRIRDDILSFYYDRSLSFCKTGLCCNNKHKDLCIHNKIFEMMKYLKPKYSDTSIISSFTSLFKKHIIYIQNIETIDTMLQANLIQDMLIYLNNEFWTIYTFQSSLRRTPKTNILMPMESILENEYVDTEIFRFH